MKIALITGGSSGLGRAVSLELVSSNSEIIVINADINPPPSPHPRIIYKKCNVTKYEDLASLFHDVIGEYGYLDVLINNAGVTSKTEFHLDSRESLERVVDVNFKAIVMSTQLAIQQVQRIKKSDSSQGNLSIVNIASMAGVIPLTVDPVYTGTKFAVVGFTRALSRYQSLDGITVNAVCPFFFETPILAKGRQTHPGMAKVLDKLPFVNIKSVVKAVIMAVDSKSTGDCFSVHPDGISKL